MRKVLLLAALAFGAFQAEAQSGIGYHNMEDVTLMDTDSFQDHNINITTVPDSAGQHETQELTVEIGSGQAWVFMGTDCEVMVDQHQNPLALGEGEEIGPSGTWKNSPGLLNDGFGNWVDVTDKYLGVRVKKDGAWHYGWVRMDVDATPTYVKIKDYAAHNTAGTVLQAGEGATSGIRYVKNDNIKLWVYGRNLHISGLETQADISILNLQGQVVMALRTNSTGDLHGLPAGLYIAQVLYRGEATTKKILLER